LQLVLSWHCKSILRLNWFRLQFRRISFHASVSLSGMHHFMRNLIRTESLLLAFFAFVFIVGCGEAPPPKTAADPQKKTRNVQMPPAEGEEIPK